MTIANRLTFIRIISVPFFIFFMSFPHFWFRILALITFIIAAITDIYDGFLARYLKEVTNLGKFLDPIADKLIVSAAFIAFVAIPELIAPVWMVIIIISREFIITGLRTLAASQGRIIAASTYGKFKTTSQMISIIVILLVLVIQTYFQQYLHISLQDLIIEKNTWHNITGICLLYIPPVFTFIPTILTVISGVQYIKEHKDIIWRM